MIKNSTAGKVFYGMHFCPGVARYPEKDNLMIFINENTIRDMNPTFSAKPVFVEHVDGVDDDLDEVRTEADGWVVESFYNEADGKTWAKFIIVSDRGIKAIARGYRLSNAYEVSKKGASGVWNGVPYEEEVLAGEFEHLALVKNPRYEESVVLTPEQFKEYNEEQKENLKRFANSKGGKQMGFRLFKRQEDTAVDPDKTLVELEKSGKVVPLAKVMNAYEKMLNLHGYADQEHMVKLHDGSECSVGDLLKKHKKALNDIESLKKAHEDEGKEIDRELDADDRHEDDFEEDFDEVGDRGGDKGLDDDDDELPSRNEEEDDRHEDSDDEDRHEDEDASDDQEEEGDDDGDEEENSRRKNRKHKNRKHHNSKLSKDARRRIERIKNARESHRASIFNKGSGVAPIHLTMDAVNKGQSEYGSKK